jgi:hypothetical protein
MKPSDMIAKKIVDQNSQTVAEMFKETLLDQAQIRKLAVRYVEQGKWERVYKRIGTRLLPAYRVKKK